MSRHLGALWVAAVVAGSAAVAAQVEPVRAQRGGPRESVLFPFDDHSVPLSYGLRFGLVQGTRRGLVLRPGESGPDAQHIINYGSIVNVDGELRMWYLCTGDLDPPIRDPDYQNRVRLFDTAPVVEQEAIFRVCYATSRDGIEWEKPALGLVSYGGSTHNNLVELPLGEHRSVNIVVIHDPEDGDPARRFKMALQNVKYRGALAVAYSADGVRWKESPRNPIGDHFFEISGLTRHDGLYYLNGHGGSPRFGPSAHAPRRMVTYLSSDFENWSEATALSFERETGEVPTPWKGNAGEQVHCGASLWNRGNVIIGFYGMWHGHPSDDRRLVTMDLGLIVSNDALHYREPITDFRIVPAHEEGETVTHTFNPKLGSSNGASLFGLALKQGQGWENLGDYTFYWYSVWFQGDVRLATWPRDRLGYFEVDRGAGSKAQASPHFVSAPIRVDSPAQRVFLNVDGLSEDAYATIEVYDDRLRPLPEYSGSSAARVSTSGFRQPAGWRAGMSLPPSDRPIRLRVNFEGKRPEDIRVYAVYVAAQ